MATIVSASIKKDGTGDYTSINAWESATRGDLVSADEVRIGIIADTASYNENINISGSTTDATRYRHLMVSQSFRHNGLEVSGPYVQPTASGHVFQINEDYFEASWLRITGWTGSSAEAFRVNGDETKIHNIVFHDSPGAFQDGVYAGTNGITIHVHNCLFYNLGRQAVHIQGIQNCTIYVDNCTGWKLCQDTAGSDTYCAFGFQERLAQNLNNSGSTMRIRNVVAGNLGEGCPAFRDGTTNVDTASDGWTADSDYNASDDTTSPGANSIDNISDWEVEFISISGSLDFHLEGSSQLVNAGTASSTDYETDIDGDTRSTQWDIGSDEYSGISTPTIIESNGAFGQSDNEGVVYASASNPDSNGNKLVFERSDDSGGSPQGNWSQVFEIEITSSQWPFMTDNTVTGSVTYHYRAKLIDTSSTFDSSSYSSTIQINVSAPPPTNVSASIV